MSPTGEPPRVESGDDALAEVAATQTKAWSEAGERIRARTDTSAKALAALGTTGVTAAGLSKFSDVFPLPAQPTEWHIATVVGVLLGLLLMAAAVAALTAQLWWVSQPVFMSPSLDRMREELDKPSVLRRLLNSSNTKSPEYDLVKEVYEDAARLNRIDTIEAYAERAFALERVAQRRSSNAEVASIAKKSAAMIRNEVRATMARAGTTLVRHRAYAAVRSGETLVIGAGFFLGVLLLGVGTDYLDSERSARVATAKACAEAVTAIRAADPTGTDPLPAAMLPDVCGGKLAVPTAATAVATPATETSGAAIDLSARYDACVTAAKGDRAACTTIRSALIAVTDEP